MRCSLYIGVASLDLPTSSWFWTQRKSDFCVLVSSNCISMVKSKLKGGNLGSWMATKDASLNAADYAFPIEI